MAEKIVILGIANGGKTSLLRTLKREFKSLANLKVPKNKKEKYPDLLRGK